MEVLIAVESLEDAAAEERQRERTCRVHPGQGHTAQMTWRFSGQLAGARRRGRRKSGNRNPQPGLHFMYCIASYNVAASMYVSEFRRGSVGAPGTEWKQISTERSLLLVPEIIGIDRAALNLVLGAQISKSALRGTTFKFKGWII